VKDLCMESALDISLDRCRQLGGALPARRPNKLSPRARQLATALVIWAAAMVLFGGVTLHHEQVAPQADTDLCKR
jgi:hypothetical protein